MNLPDDFSVVLNGQTYSPVMVDATAGRIIWVTNCADCGDRFELWTTHLFVYPNRRCQACKAPGKPVRKRSLQQQEPSQLRCGTVAQKGATLRFRPKGRSETVASRSTLGEP